MSKELASCPVINRDNMIRDYIKKNKMKIDILIKGELDDDGFEVDSKTRKRWVKECSYIRRRVVDEVDYQIRTIKQKHRLPDDEFTQKILAEAYGVIHDFNVDMYNVA